MASNISHLFSPSPSVRALRCSRNLIWNTIDVFSRSTKGFFFVQIGANDGVTGDPVYRLIQRDRWTGILVEPVRHVYEKLLVTYRNRNDLILVNCAVSSRTEVRRFYRLKPSVGSLPAWHDQLGSFYPEVVLKHGNLIPDIDSLLVEEDVICVGLIELLEKHFVRHIDLLYIDAEGYDFEIIKQLDFDSFQPVWILFEHKHLTMNDRDECETLLHANGYTTYMDRLSGNTLAGRAGPIL